MTEKNGLWMYCITENQTQPDLEDLYGIHGTSRIFTVAQGDFVAVVSEEPMKKYPLVRDYLITHQLVNERVMQKYRILPVKFCTIAQDKEQIVRDVLLPKAAEFRQKLSEMAETDEYGLRIRWKDMDEVFKEIGESNEKVRAKKERLFSLSAEHRRAELIDIGHLVQEALQNKNAHTAKTIMDALTPLSCEFKSNHVLGDAMILNAAFLVKKDHQAAFDRAIELLDEKYGDTLHFKYVGPIPPFNFVEIVIKWNNDPSFTSKEEQHVSVG